jgi:hypothetical protein
MAAPSRKRWLGRALALGCLAWAAAPAARAQLVDCPEIRGNAAAWKVIFDEPAFTSPDLAADDELQKVRNRLYFTVDNQLQALSLEMQSAAQPPVVLLPVSCRGRRPRDASDFTSSRSQDLTANRVVLEVWALLDGTRQGDRIADREAQIGYVMPPLRYYEPGSVALPGFYRLRYPRAGAGLAGILEGLPEIPAYATLGLGLRAAKAREYDLAVQFLKRAEALLGRSAGLGTDLTAIQQRALLDYAKRKSCETVTAALADPDYKGGLKLAYAGRRPCP